MLFARLSPLALAMGVRIMMWLWTLVCVCVCWEVTELEWRQRGRAGSWCTSVQGATGSLILLPTEQRFLLLWGGGGRGGPSHDSDGAAGTSGLQHPTARISSGEWLLTPNSNQFFRPLCYFKKNIADRLHYGENYNTHFFLKSCCDGISYKLITELR